jgi:transcriptional regulator with XRE-family HTH domain
MWEVRSMYKLGEQIAQARKSAKITQEKLADELGLTRQAISSWERDNSQPDIDMVIKLSRILNYRFMIENNVYLGIMSEEEAAEGTLDQDPNNGINTAVQHGKKKSFIPWIISFIAESLLRS